MITSKNISARLHKNNLLERLRSAERSLLVKDNYIESLEEDVIYLLDEREAFTEDLIVLEGDI